MYVYAEQRVMKAVFICEETTGSGSASWKVYFNGYQLKAGWDGKVPRCSVSVPLSDTHIHTRRHTSL